MQKVRVIPTGWTNKGTGEPESDWIWRWEPPKIDKGKELPDIRFEIFVCVSSVGGFLCMNCQLQVSISVGLSSGLRLSLFLHFLLDLAFTDRYLDIYLEPWLIWFRGSKAVTSSSWCYHHQHKALMLKLYASHSSQKILISSHPSTEKSI